MEDINKTIGKNLLALRKRSKLTQLELAEKFNYSDKSISKWENGESLPSIEVLYNLCSFYGVTLDALTSEELPPEEKATENKENKDFVFEKKYNTKLMITLLSVSAIWVAVSLAYIILKIAFNINLWMLFVWALPASALLVVIFNSIFNKYHLLFPILSVFLWLLISSLHIQFLDLGRNIWPIYLLGIPIQISIIFWWGLVKKKKIPIIKKKSHAVEEKTEASEETKKD